MRQALHNALAGLFTHRFLQPGGLRASGSLGWTWLSKGTGWWCKKWSRWGLGMANALWRMWGKAGRA